jgi:hypothetical protein
MVKFGILVAIGLVVTIATGAVSGHLSQRWGPAPDLIAAGDQLKTMPEQFGNWQLVEEDTMEESVVRMLSCSGYVNRKYVDRNSGEDVDVAIMVGPSGPISVHTPEICFSSRDYTLESDRQRVELTDADERLHTVWSSTFRSNGALGAKLRVYYAWLPDDIWTAADSPRFTFAGRPLLFKLQAAAPIMPGKSNDSRDPVRRFLQDLLKSGWKVRG